MTDYDKLRTAVEAGDAPAFVPRWVADTLTAVAQERRPVLAVLHPLGFTCLPVERVGEYGICVHLWGAGGPHEDPTTSQIHAHSWELTSYVLYGQVRNELIELSEDAPSHRVFEVHSDSDGDEIRPTARLVRPYTTDAAVHRSGEVYELRCGRFHTTTLPDLGDAATVVLGRVRPGAGDLSLGPVGMQAHRVVRSTCDRVRTAAVARSALRTLRERGII